MTHQLTCTSFIQMKINVNIDFTVVFIGEDGEVFYDYAVEQELEDLVHRNSHMKYVVTSVEINGETFELCNLDLENSEALKMFF